MANLEETLDRFFKDGEGYVYAPSKRVKDFFWKQAFFKWPDEKENLQTYIEETTRKDEVYLSPALWKRQRISPDTFLGTNFVWVEFDGNAPKELDGIPHPSIRLQSSTEGHEHWYWELEEFATDAGVVEAVSKRLTYSLGADKSGWDCTQVLRPPETIHHDSGLRTKLVEYSDRRYRVQDFDSVDKPPDIDLEVNGRLPDVGWLLAKYQWGYDTFDLLNKTIEKGKRDEAYSRLAFDCIEMGMANKEILAILHHADDKWGKFTKRNDRRKRLTAILRYARTQIATKEEQGLVAEPLIYRFTDFMESEINLDWLIPGVLSVAGSGITFGPPGIGKSTWMLRMGMALATGGEFLNWEIAREAKTLFLSLEMAHDELKEFFKDMRLTQEEQFSLNDQFFVMPVGHSYALDRFEVQEELVNLIDTHGIEFIIIDSLGMAMAGDVNSDDDVKRLNNFLNYEVRANRNCAYWFVHFPRKPGRGQSRKADDVYDMFGSIYVSQNAQTVINLEDRAGSKDTVSVEIFKSRLSQEKAKFQVERNNDRSFSVKEKEEKRATRRNKSGDSERVSETSRNIAPFGGGHRGRS